MAVYTHVDDYMLAEFLSRYDHGEARSFKGIAEGVENSNYYLETTTSRFVLTLYEARADVEDLPYFLNMMEHLSSKGVVCPLPVKDKNGSALQSLAGKPACMITFLTGVSLNHMKPVHCSELGKNLADIHNALADYDANRENTLSVDTWVEMATDLAPRANEVEAGLADMIANEAKFLKDNWPSDLPTGTIHADLFPDNTLFTGDKLTGLIDFYFACTDFFAYDLAICLNAWCFDENQNFMAPEADAMIAAYTDHHPMSDDEKAALPILCRGAALRFLLTRLHDWLKPANGAVVNHKDPKEFSRRLKFFQNEDLSECQKC